MNGKRMFIPRIRISSLEPNEVLIKNVSERRKTMVR